MEDLDLTETKEYKRALKHMGEENLRDFLKKSEKELGDVIVGNSVHIQEATNKTKTTAAYVSAVETKKLFDKALSDDLKPYKAANDLAALLLRTK